MSPPLTNDSFETGSSQSRRQFLLGIGAATAAAAGCVGRNDTTDDGSTDSSDDMSTDSPTTASFSPVTDLPFDKWLTAASDELVFAYANLKSIPTNIGSDAALDESLDDPLVSYPLVLNQRVIGLGQLRLSFAGLTGAIAPETESKSTVNEVTVLNRTTIAEGSFATDILNERLVEPTDETWGIAYEQTDQIEGFDQYEPSEIPDSFEDDPPIIAVSGETVVVGPEVSRIQQLLTGDNESDAGFFERNDNITELFELAGAGDLLVGEIGSRNDTSAGIRERFDTDLSFKPRSGEDSLAALSFEETSNTVSSQFVLSADDLSENRRQTIKSEFGTAAVGDSVSIEVNDSRITANGTYNLENLGLIESEGSEDEGLSQSEAADLVAPDALTFQYEPPGENQFGELWVAVTEETDAAALRVEAASGGYTEIQPQDRAVGVGDSVAVRVDPDGDSVTVSVVDDDGAEGKLTTQSVPTEDLSPSVADRAVPADALSFSYESPDTGEFGSLTVEVVADIDAETLVARPQNAPSLFTDRAGSLAGDTPIETGTTLETAVDPDGDSVVVYATVDDATGEVARWQGPN
jgi:hypothetical protein